jgi:UDP-glucose 4-epimerase
MVHELADVGEGVVVLDNLSTGFDWAVAKGVPLIVGDTGDQNSVAQIIREHKVDSIIHFAAWLVVPDSLDRRGAPLKGADRRQHRQAAGPATQIVISPAL